jgi:hypothetical protein
MNMIVFWLLYVYALHKQQSEVRHEQDSAATSYSKAHSKS